MLQNLNLQADHAVLPPLSVQPVAAEFDRRDFDARLADLHTRLHRERRAQFYRDLANVWPIALGLCLSCCAAPIHDAAAGYAPVLAKFIFPLSALAAFHDVQIGSGATAALSQIMLYAQFILDGLLTSMLLRQRSHWFAAGLQVVVFHLVLLFSIGWAAGSLSALTMN